MKLKFLKGDKFMENNILNERYEILDILGTGGMGDVYLGRHIKLDSKWAIKRIKKNFKGGTDVLNEFKILKKINHNSLPRVFDMFEDDTYVYIVIDYIEGISLQKYLKDKVKLSEKETINIAKKLCKVLIYLHNFKPNPIIYRDLKPSNIIIINETDIKLVDFGIAREFKKDAKLDTVFIGTRGYAAPEQYGYGQTNQASDIYSLGILMYEMMTGLNPYRFKSCKKEAICLIDDISKELNEIIIKCTMNNPLERYNNVIDLLYEIDKIMINDSNIKKGYITRFIVPKDYKKVIGLVGETGSGVSTCAKAVCEGLVNKEIKVAMVDIGNSRKFYTRLGFRHEKMNNLYEGSNIKELDEIIRSKYKGIMIEKNAKLFLINNPKSDSKKKERNLDLFIEKIKSNHDIVIIIQDLYDDQNFLKRLDNIYIISDMNFYNIQRYSKYMDDLKTNSICMNNIKFIINKYIKANISCSDIVNGIIKNMKEDEELIDYDIKNKIFKIPFIIENYYKSINNEYYNGFTCRNFSSEFKNAIEEIVYDIYPIKKRKSKLI